MGAVGAKAGWRPVDSTVNGIVTGMPRQLVPEFSECVDEPCTTLDGFGGRRAGHLRYRRNHLLFADRYSRTGQALWR
jgi:hypothetical protein